MSALSLVPDSFPPPSDFSEEEEHTGIHLRPTTSMPPALENDASVENIASDTDVTGISNTISALLAEAEAEEKLEDLTEAAAEEEEEREEVMVAQASLPPAADSAPSPPVRSRPERVRRMASMAFAIVALGFGAGFFFTQPAEVPAPASATAAATAAPEIVQVPMVTISGTVPSAPVPSAPVPAAEGPAATATDGLAAPAQTAEAVKPPATLADANWMLDKNNLARAEQIYQSILAKGGNDHEALTGLGKVALRRGQEKEAITFFERALARQPQYFPARLGIADALWNAGKKDAAKARYAALREGYADNMIPARIVERTR